jgi:hypothetical protein
LKSIEKSNRKKQKERRKERREIVKIFPGLWGRERKVGYPNKVVREINP